MSDLNNLIILQKMYDFYLWFYPALGRYPKHEKFVLTTQTKETCLQIMTLIVKANKVRNRKPVLFEIDTELDWSRKACGYTSAAEGAAIVRGIC